MGTGWNIFIVLITFAMLAGCVALLIFTGRKSSDDNEETTGHVWDDDLTELNNPLPRWWLYSFYITIGFAVIYLVLYPGLGDYEGKLGWSSESEYDEQIKEVEEKLAPLFAQYTSTPVEQLAGNKDAVALGGQLYMNYCAACHGSDARGAKGYPNLTDQDWLYGSDGASITHTILNGRNGVMPAFGAILTEDQRKRVSAYVRVQGGATEETEFALGGKKTYEQQCAFCHGKDAEGNPALGAPNLADDVWLHGGDFQTVLATVTNGRTSYMPPHKKIVGDAKAHLLAAYVYSLSQ